MFENVAAVQARIDEIRSRFRMDDASGEVSIAPHPTAGRELQSSQVKPFFPEYLLQEIEMQAATAQDSTSYDDVIKAAAEKYDVDERLIKAVIKAESNFRPNAVSRAGAQGLMQLMPATSAALGVTDPFDVTQNIFAGTRYLKGQMERFAGNTQLALAAYNAGPTAVAKYGGVPPYRETRRFVSGVLANMNDYTR